MELGAQTNDATQQKKVRTTAYTPTRRPLSTKDRMITQALTLSGISDRVVVHLVVRAAHGPPDAVVVADADVVAVIPLCESWGVLTRPSKERGQTVCNGCFKAQRDRYFTPHFTLPDATPDVRTQLKVDGTFKPASSARFLPDFRHDGSTATTTLPGERSSRITS